jgi:hypothetical protein
MDFSICLLDGCQNDDKNLWWVYYMLGRKSVVCGKPLSGKSIILNCNLDRNDSSINDQKGNSCAFAF